MNDLRQILWQEVARHGSITFARFMELALFCPNFGYYERPEVSPGRTGDFYTSVSVGPLFGELLARQFVPWLEEIAPNRRMLVEAGAHDGRLALDILRWLSANQPGIAETIEYWIVEPSQRRQEVQKATLVEFRNQVRWADDWGELVPNRVTGVIFSNELLDAMPVHRLGWDAPARKWFEWGVTIQGDALAWTRIPLQPDWLASDPILGSHSCVLSPANLPGALLDVLPDGFTTEISPAAIKWWSEAARALKAGRILTFDYGLTAEELFAPQRKDGTLRAYYRHHQSPDILARAGEQDLTAHVNFSAIRATGEAAGLGTLEFTTQGQFLTRILASDPEFTADPEFSSQFQTLTHPEHLGQRFKVLVQQPGAVL